MAIVGFHFTKFKAEKFSPAKGKVKINNNVSILKIEESTMNASDRTGVKVTFAFDSAYEPKIGELRFEGNLMMLEEKKAAKELIETWKEKKQIMQPFVTPIVNNILDRCNMQALIMARDLGLPSPIPLPKASIKSK